MIKILDIANKYEKELQELFINTWYDEKYKYFHCGCYSDLFKVPDSNWSQHSFVSKDRDNKIIGYIAYNITRGNDSVDGLGIINFTDDKITFGLDLSEVLKNIFEKYNFRKLTYSVVVGNPIEKSYDKLTQKYGGSIIGTHKQHVRLIDNKFYDQKFYEIFREDYFNSIKKENIK